MNKYLPSKKFTLIIFSIILALAIIFISNLLIKKTRDSQAKLVATQAEKKLTLQEFKTIDTDSDGLPDWEEALWKTDPKKSDTDGDGTTDGEEIKLNRDPLIANTAKPGQTPTDLFDTGVVAANKKRDEEFAKLTTTDQLAQTFFSQYLASKNASGAALSQSSKQVILDTAMSKLQVSYSQKYYLSDLKILDTTSTTTLKEFVNKIGLISFNHKSKGSEMEIFLKAMSTNDETILNGLDPIIKSYKELTSELLAVPVPKNYAPSYLSMLNNLDGIGASIEKMRSILSDPAGSIGFINVYKTSLVNLKGDILNLKTYVYARGIVFGPKEYGYSFINVI